MNHRFKIGDEIWRESSSGEGGYWRGHVIDVDEERREYLIQYSEHPGNSPVWEMAIVEIDYVDLRYSLVENGVQIMMEVA